VTMTMRAGPGSALGPEYDPFLFASIGVDRNGMPVSVLSGLARSDLDPWQEAARLAGLPGKSAIEVLAALIETLPGNTSGQSEARTAATHLIGLLPRPRAECSAPGQTPNSLDAMMKSRSWWVYVILMAFVLGSQWLIAMHPPPAPQKDDVHTAREVAPPANSGQ